MNLVMLNRIIYTNKLRKRKKKKDCKVKIKYIHRYMKMFFCWIFAGAYKYLLKLNKNCFILSQKHLTSNNHNLVCVLQS